MEMMINVMDYYCSLSIVFYMGVSLSSGLWSFNVGIGKSKLAFV